MFNFVDGQDLPLLRGISWMKLFSLWEWDKDISGSPKSST